MADVTTLKYPKKSHRKMVVLPEHSSDLAEFFGIMIGDGGINNPWQANITLNSIRDAKYAKYVARLCKKLFGISPVARKRKGKNALVLSITSTSLVDYLVNNGLIRGNKIKNGLRIPEWIMVNPEYAKKCVRGLVDTDGCIYIHTHKVKGKIYRSIELTFTSYSTELVFQVAEILDKFSVLPHITKRGLDVYLYRHEMIARYLDIIGSSNHRLLSEYSKWRDARAV